MDKPDNDAAGRKPESAPTTEAEPITAEPILIDEELEAEALEELLNESHPPIRPPRLKELLESTDPPSRFLTYLSIAFACLALVCIGTLVQKYLEARRSHPVVTLEDTKLKPEKVITETLGEFKLILKPIDSPNDGELRVDMVAECSNQEACTYLKGHLVQARDIVIPVLVNTRRQELLQPESKNLIRRRITEQLNTLPLGGKVIQVLFTDLTIEDHPDS